MDILCAKCEANVFFFRSSRPCKAVKLEDEGKGTPFAGEEDTLAASG
jgi:hypothetical protein